MAVELDTTGNGAIDIEKGGTNATTAVQALSNLGGQPFDADLTTLSSGTYAQKRALIEAFAKPVLGVDALRTTMADFDGDCRYLAYHTASGDGGHGTFCWAAASTAADDNGVTIAVTGVATGRWVRQTGDKVDVRWFGLVLYDDTKGATNWAAIRNALKYCITRNPGVPYDGQATMYFPEGTAYISGNSPFCLTRTELEALGPAFYRYRRGMSIKGAGRLATNLVLQNNGSQSWFWDNYDVNFTESNRSVASTFTFEGIGFKSYAGFTPTRRYSVAEALQVCGFRFYSGGWESFMVFNGCSFQGLDTAFDFEGVANVDHNTFNDCMFQNIIDNILILNNDQVIQTRFNSTDFLGIHGNCFKVLGNGGGNILMNGGSVVLYPKFKEGNVPDLDSTEIRAFYAVDLADHGTSTTLGPGNNKCEFNHLRFEIYDDYQKTVHATRDAGTVGGSINPYFDNCSWVNENNMNASGVIIAAPDTLRETVIMQNNIAGNVTFKRSTLHKRHQYVIRDNDAAALAASRIQFDDCELYWDPNATTLGGGLRERCILDSTDDGMFVGNNIMAITTNANFPKVRHVLDFAYNVNSGGATIARNPKMADMLSAQVAWPQVGATELKVFLPEGSVVYGIKFYKPAQSPPAGTPVNLYYILEDYADNDLYLTTNQSEVLAINVQAPLTAPYTVPAAPNNYVTLKPAGASGSAQPTGGFAILEYY